MRRCFFQLLKVTADFLRFSGMPLKLKDLAHFRKIVIAAVIALVALGKKGKVAYIHESSSEDP